MNFDRLFLLSAFNYTYIWRLLTLHMFASVAGRYHALAVPEIIRTAVWWKVTCVI
jgi:hypothetical protein